MTEMDGVEEAYETLLEKKIEQAFKKKQQEYKVNL